MNQPKKRTNVKTSGFDGLKALKNSNTNKQTEAPKSKKSGHAAKKQQTNNASLKNKSNREFSLSLSRQFNVKRYPVIATICLLQKRDDMVSLLKQAQQNPNNLPIRLTSYLKKEGLIDNENTLTDKAKQVCNTGKMPVSERGLYHIWYSDNDPLLGTRALLIQRDNAFKEPKHQIMYKGRDAAQSAFAINSNSSENIYQTLTVKFSGSEKENSNKLSTEDIISISPEVICNETDNKALDLTWGLTLDESNITLEGSLNILSGRDLTQNSPVDFEYEENEFLSNASSIFSSMATHLDGHWQQQDKRASIPFVLTKRYPGILDHFKLNNYPEFQMETEQGYFDNVDIKHLPVEPIQKEASQWHLAWLERYHENDFREINRAKADQLAWLSHPELKQCELIPLTDNALIGALSKEKNPHSYWHCAAINDLTPSLSTIAALPLTLIDKESVDIKVLIKKLSLDKPYEKFIYSDRYIKTNHQQSMLKAIVQPLSNSEITIFTESSDVETLTDKCPDIWKIESFTKRADNHDRYWIFQSNDHTTAWKCSVSLDFLANEGPSYYAKGYPTFTPIVIDQLPKYLLNALVRNTSEVTA